MNLPHCAEGTSILEHDLHDCALHNKVESIYVMETLGGFFVVARIRTMGRNGTVQWWYLCTRRERNSPKLFSRLERLNERLKELCPGLGFRLVRTVENKEAP